MALKKGSVHERSVVLLLSGLRLVLSSLKECLANGRDLIAVIVAACLRREHVEIESFARKRSAMGIFLPQSREGSD